MGEALGILQDPQFLSPIDQHIGVRAHTKPATLLQERRGREDAIAQICLRYRSQSDDRTASRHPTDLSVSRVGGMHQAPPFIHPLVLQQPFDRPATGPGDAVFNLLGLLGDVDVNNPTLRDLHNADQLLRSDGPQTVRSYAHGGTWQTTYGAPTRLDDACEALNVVD